MASPGLLGQVGGNADLQYQDGDDDREDAVAERLDPLGIHPTTKSRGYLRSFQKPPVAGS